MSKERVTICDTCPFLNSTKKAKFMKTVTGDDSCGVCGCPVRKKARVADEECPKKYWIMEIENKETQLSLGNLSSDISDLTLNDGVFTLDLKELAVGSEPKTVNLQLRNNRNGEITSLEGVSSCGCTIPSKLPKTLLTGEKTTFTIQYTATKNPRKISQTVVLKAKHKKEAIITQIKITGEVK